MTANIFGEAWLVWDLFHAADGTAFADIPINGHRETWPIRSKRFRGWLRQSHYETTGAAATATDVRTTLDLLEARAQFDGPQRTVHIRTAQDAERFYLDLADENWRAVEIDRTGWRVIASPPVRFRRSASMLPLPVPERGGSVELLNSFLNVASRNDFVLIVAWLLATLRYGGPYPLLAISGEQGSAKTVLSKLLKALIDPNAAPVRALSRQERELMIAANNGHLLAFDNLSGMPTGLSDALCRLASGGSFAVRQLYTDGDEVLFQAARPILLNGIEDVISRPDLADRAIFLTLPPIADEMRRPEMEVWREFELARPRILGSLLDAVAQGLRARNIQLLELPRMADFALWAAACETALWPAGTFARAYAANRSAATDSVLEADPVATYVRRLLANRSTWTGSATDLLHSALDFMNSEHSAPGTDWPENPRALAGRLRRAQTFLRARGIEITFSREGRVGNRMITLQKKLESTVGIVSRG